MELEDLQDSGTATEKVPRVVVRVEADQIAMQDTEEDLVSHRQDPIYFTARKWGVQEEADLDICLCRSDLFS